MGSRAHYFEYLTDRKGNVLAGATVRVYQQGTTTNITETMYQGDTGVATTLTNPLTSDANGLIEFWLDVPKRVDIKVEANQRTTVTKTVDVIRKGLVWKSAWATSTAYQTDDLVASGGSTYVATADHTSAAATEPGVGASWATVWALFAAKGTDGGVTDHGALGGLGDDDHPQYYNQVRGDARYQALSAAGGKELGYASTSTTQTGIGTSITDLTGLSVTVSCDGTRAISVVASVELIQRTASTPWTYVAIREGATVLGASDMGVHVANGYVKHFFWARLVPSAGSHTYKLSAYTQNNTIDTNSNSSAPAFIQVIQLGT